MLECVQELRFLSSEARLPTLQAPGSRVSTTEVAFGRGDLRVCHLRSLQGPMNLLFLSAGPPG